MVKNGFDKTATKEQFENLDKEVKEVKSLVIDLGGRAKILENRVDFIENTLNISAIKKN